MKTFILLLVISLILISGVKYYEIAYGHVLNPSDCTSIGLVLDSGASSFSGGSIGGICVESLDTVCVTTMHSDLIGGGFRNTGSDQFGNFCKEVHPSSSDFPAPVAPVFDFFQFFNSIGNEGQMIIIGIILVPVVIIGLIIFVIMRRRK